MIMKDRLHKIICLVLFLLTGMTINARQAEPFKNFDTYVTHAMDEWQIPGLAIAIVKDNKVVYVKGYGLREINKPDKVDEHTIFAIGSNTKAFTATALCLLAHEKKFP